jgi:hypothetical protein
MQQKENEQMRMTRQHYEFIANTIGPMVGWPSHLQSIADELEKTNPRFDRQKFLDRATKAWEDKHEIDELEDQIPY